MALEHVVYQQQIFCHNNNGPYTPYGAAAAYWPDGCDFDDLATTFDSILEENSNSRPSSHQWSTSPNASSSADPQQICNVQATAGGGGDDCCRSKRRRPRPRKNVEEIERQRLTHISVERNRRKQMNEYLSVLRGLMPSGYARKGDQASIVGGAINYVKELEQQLQFLDGQKHLTECAGSSSSSPFSASLNYPQYSTIPGRSCLSDIHRSKGATADVVADIEVTMVESSYADLKARSKKRPKQLIKLVSGLQVMRLTILHLNVTTADQIVLYSLSLKVEDDCTLSSADEIAAGVNQIFIRVKEDLAGSNMG